MTADFSITTEAQHAEAVEAWEFCQNQLCITHGMSDQEVADLKAENDRLAKLLLDSPFEMSADGKVYRKPGLTVEDIETIIDVPAVVPITTEDGFLLDPENGSVLGHVQDLPEKPFQIDSDEAANWALKLLSSIEGTAAGLRLRRDALIAQMDKVIAEVDRKASWWEYRFGPDLRTYAKTQLKGKSKTKHFDWGSVAFRESKGSNTIVSDEEALQYVETFAPQLVKQKRWVGITEVLEAATIAEKALGEPQTDLGFMKHSGPSTSAKISTGISIEGKKK